MGVGGRRRTEVDVGEVVSNLRPTPPTQTPVPEPWLHHNHGLGQLDDGSHLRPPKANQIGGARRPLGARMGSGASAHHQSIEGGVEGVLSTASHDLSTTNSAPARPMSYLTFAPGLWRHRESVRILCHNPAYMGVTAVNDHRTVVGGARWGITGLRQARAGKWPNRMAGARRTGSWSSQSAKPTCASRWECRWKWGSSEDGGPELLVPRARGHGSSSSSVEKPPCAPKSCVT